MFVGSRDWTFLLSVFVIVSSLHFQFSGFSVMSPIVLDIDFSERYVVEELGVYVDGQDLDILSNHPRNIN